MLLALFLAPLLSLKHVFGLTLKANPQSPRADSSAQMIWIVDHFGTPLAPDNFTLFINKQKIVDVQVNGLPSGTEGIAVSTEGSYFATAMWPIGSNTPIGTLTFQVQAPLPPPPPSTATSEATSSTPTQSISTPTQTSSLLAVITTVTTTVNGTLAAVVTTTTVPTSDTSSGIASNTTSPSSPNHTSTTSLKTLLDGSSSDTESGTVVTTSPSSNLVPPSPSNSDNSTSFTSSSSSSPSSSSSNTGTIAGAVVGAIAFFALVAIVLFLLRKKYRRNREAPIFDKDMMVRTPGLSLYGLSNSTNYSGEGRDSLVGFDGEEPEKDPDLYHFESFNSSEMRSRYLVH